MPVLANVMNVILGFRQYVFGFGQCSVSFSHFVPYSLDHGQYGPYMGLLVNEDITVWFMIIPYSTTP